MKNLVVLLFLLTTLFEQKFLYKSFIPLLCYSVIVESTINLIGTIQLLKF